MAVVKVSHVGYDMFVYYNYLICLNTTNKLCDMKNYNMRNLVKWNSIYIIYKKYIYMV